MSREKPSPVAPDVHEHAVLVKQGLPAEKRKQSQTTQFTP